MKYILVARSCQDCGGDVAASCFDNEPTEEDNSKLIEELGGMFCISTFLFKQEEDEYGSKFKLIK